jgi:Ca2+-transporting ATPase
MKKLERRAILCLLLAAVLLIPGLKALFQVMPLSDMLLGAIVGLAFCSMLVIQLIKAIRTKK